MQDLTLASAVHDSAIGRFHYYLFSPSSYHSNDFSGDTSEYCGPENCDPNHGFCPGASSSSTSSAAQTSTCPPPVTVTVTASPTP